MISISQLLVSRVERRMPVTSRLKGVSSSAGRLAAGVVARGAPLRRRLRSAAHPVQASVERVAELLDVESTGPFGMLTSVSTVTIFEGEATQAEAHLRTRVLEVVKLNPWLQGRLVRDGRRGRVHLRFLEEASALLPATFSVSESSALHPSFSPRELSRLTANHTVARNDALVDAPGAPLFRVTLFRPAPHGSSPRSAAFFAVCVSLSHVLGDGHTFYALHDMLSAAAQPRALTVDRRQSFSAEMARMLGGADEVNEWMSSPGGWASFGRKTMFAPGWSFLQQAVHPGWIEAGKRRAAAAAAAAAAGGAGGPAFVSSNDLLTSWLFRASGCDMGWMAVNFRGRLKGYTADIAGNYEGLMPYFAEDFASPALIRRSLQGHPARLRRAVSGSRRLPDFLSSAVVAPPHVCLVTSWASFYHDDVALPGARHVRHAPVTDPDAVLPMDIVTLFRPRAGQLEVLAMTRGLTAERLRELGQDAAAAMDPLAAPSDSAPPAGAALRY